jgi:adenine-specific DNA-methyltransferase
MLPNFGAIEDSNIVHGALKKISKANPASEITFPAGFPFEGGSAVFKGELGGSEKEYILSERMVFEDGKLKFPTTIKAGWGMANQVRDWIAGKETFDSKGQRVVRFYFNKQGILFYEKERGTYNPKTVLSGIGSTKNGSSDLENLLGIKAFDFPKPVDLIKYLILLVTKKDDLVVDFFSGSATTAHATMQLNAEDARSPGGIGNRRFLLIQLPELCDPKSEAFKAGYKNICDIGMERIRHAGAKIKGELLAASVKSAPKSEFESYESTLESGGFAFDLDAAMGDESTSVDDKTVDPEQLDIGFRVYDLDTSNLRLWPYKVCEDGEEVLQKLEETSDRILPDRTDEEIVTELMLRLGFDLCTPIIPLNCGKKTVYGLPDSDGEILVIICLAENITPDDVEDLIQHSPARVLFADKCFANLSDELNINYTLKKNAKTRVQVI